MTHERIMQDLAGHIGALDALIKEIPEAQLLGCLVMLREDYNSFIAKQLLLSHKHSLDLIDEAERIARGEMVQG